MVNDKRNRRILILVVGMLFISGFSFAIEPERPLPGAESETDSVSAAHTPPASAVSVVDHFNNHPRYIHRISIDAQPSYIFPTIGFLKGENLRSKPMEFAFNAHLKYSFQFRRNSIINKIYGGAYQGIGLGYFNFGDAQQLGNPLGIYMFQGARIARINPRLSLDYEWNFGISFGWSEYDPDNNHMNTIIGSDANAYINAGFHLNWMLSDKIDFISGVSLTHFSNGNTKFPNSGLNTIGLKVGMIYNINRDSRIYNHRYRDMQIPPFLRHVSYDVVLFGSWRRKGVFVGDGYIASPDAYPVAGFNFSPMYNFAYRFRAGLSLDGYYDGSANVYTLDYYSGGDPNIHKPPFQNQLALGISARAEYVMPYFSLNLGLGTNVWHGGGDLKGLYQTLALKVAVSRSSYLHIGYCLKDFHMPNFLMLGIGYRFNNKYPKLHH